MSQGKNVKNAVAQRRFEPYPAYKDSGVEWLGEIPAHWGSRRLRFVAVLNPRKSEIRGLDPQRSVSFVPMEAVGEYGGLCLDLSKPLASLLEGFTYFRDGDVVVAKITPCFENGKGAIATGLQGGIAFGTTELHVLRPGPALDVRFLFYVSLSDHFRRIGAAAMYGAGGQKRVPEDFVRDFPHPMPDLAEQRAIAAFLDRETARIDALVAKKERLIALLQEKRAALITRAVTNGLHPTVPMKDSGVEWLGAIPAHWEVKRLRDIAESLQTGPFGSQLHADEYVSGGFPVINPANLRSGELVPDWDCTVDDATARRLERHRLNAGDILFARRGELGRCGLATPQQEGWLCGTGSLRLRTRSDVARPGFVLRLISTSGVADWLQLQSVGSTMQNLNSAIIGRVPLALPSPEEQDAIVTHLDHDTVKIDALISKVRDAVGRLKELRTALISAAVTGKIDVREEAAA